MHDMAKLKSQFKTIDEYIAEFPKNVRDVLEEFRRVIKEAAPNAEETISYGMYAFRLNGNLVYFAAWKNHIGFYPGGSSAIEAFKKELIPYKQGKGTVQFPLDKPIPFDLVKKIVKFRVKQNESKKSSFGFSASTASQTAVSLRKSSTHP
jgi:uncharacterized protein YdhG (YjbR/CyaY superfamily)